MSYTHFVATILFHVLNFRAQPPIPIRRSDVRDRDSIQKTGADLSIRSFIFSVEMPYAAMTDVFYQLNLNFPAKLLQPCENGRLLGFSQQEHGKADVQRQQAQNAGKIQFTDTVYHTGGSV